MRQERWRDGNTVVGTGGWKREQRGGSKIRIRMAVIVVVTAHSSSNPLSNDQATTRTHTHIHTHIHGFIHTYLDKSLYHTQVGDWGRAGTSRSPFLSSSSASKAFAYAVPMPKATLSRSASYTLPVSFSSPPVRERINSVRLHLHLHLHPMQTYSSSRRSPEPQKTQHFEERPSSCHEPTK